MAGLLFLNGHYLEAMRCLLHVVKIDRWDTHSWYLLLRWLLWLDEREMVKVVLARMATQDFGDPIFAKVVEAARLYHRLLTLYPSQASQDDVSVDPPLPYKYACRLLSELVKTHDGINKQKAEKNSYLLSYASSMISEALVLASRLPAQVKMWSDEENLDCLYTLVDLKKVGFGSMAGMSLQYEFLMIFR